MAMGNRCKECGAYIGHAPLCSFNTPEQIKEHLKNYVQAFEESHKRDSNTRSVAQSRVNRARKEAEFWKGKFMVVKHENNELRKKNHGKEREI